MLIVVCVASIVLVVLVFLWITHYRQHFLCHCLMCNHRPSVSPPQKRPSMSAQQLQTEMDLITRSRASHCCFMLSSVDGENFDFFPMSFFLYSTLLIVLQIVIIMMTNDAIRFDKTVLCFLEHVVVYAVLVLSIWFSLHSFYRYYSISMSIYKLRTPTTAQLLLHFSVYAIILIILFVLQIHLWYWLFIPVIVLFCGFNTFCIYQSSAILITRYRFFMEMSECVGVNSMDHDILKSVVFTKRISLMCAVLYSIDLALFISLYRHHRSNILIYLCISWTISTFLFSLNFVRNALFWKQYWLRCKPHTKVHSVRCITSSPRPFPKCAAPSTRKPVPDPISLNIDCSPYVAIQNPIEQNLAELVISTPPLGDTIRKHIRHPASQPTLQLLDDVPPTKIKLNGISVSDQGPMRKKALKEFKERTRVPKAMDLLGFTPTYTSPVAAAFPSVAGGHNHHGVGVSVTFNDEETEKKKHVVPHSAASTVSFGGSKKSKSVPCTVNAEQVFISFGLLASSGFCTRENINSVKQLSRYKKSINKKNVGADINRANTAI